MLDISTEWPPKRRRCSAVSGDVVLEFVIVTSRNGRKGGGESRVQQFVSCLTSRNSATHENNTSDKDPNVTDASVCYSCQSESNLQTYMEEVNRLEISLADSEKNRAFDSVTNLGP